MSRFAALNMNSQDTLQTLLKSFNLEDSTGRKNLSFCPILAEDGSYMVPLALLIAQQRILHDDTINKQMVPTLGPFYFTKAVAKLVLGNQHLAVLESRVLTVQTVGGSSGIRIGCEVYSSYFNCSVVYLPVDIWELYPMIFRRIGFDVRFARFSKDCCTFDYNGYIEDIEEAPENSVIVLYACGSNPHSINISKKEWVGIAKVALRRRLRLFINCSNIGTVSGDWKVDSWPVRYLIYIGVDVICLCSFSKIFGVAVERVGCLLFIVKNEDEIPQLKKDVTMCIEAMYSNPPSLGARVLSFVFNNDLLFDELKRYIRKLAQRLVGTRIQMKEHFEKLNTPGDFSFITKQRGLYLYYKFTEPQLDFLIKKYQIFFRQNCIDLSGVTKTNYKFLCNCIHDAIVSNVKYKKCTFVP